MQFPLDHLLLYIFTFILGVSAGSFLNVIAIRSLEEKSIFWPPSRCPLCQHKLSIVELIPVFSYALLKGKCRYCRQQISWHYPVVEIFTGISFVVVLAKFGITVNGFAMVVFISTLIAICITDFKAKLIPHDITYPSMLVGIFYSSAVRNDALGTLAGIGVSYIFFDFLAFYGLKLYVAMHKTPSNEIVDKYAEKGSATKYDAIDDQVDSNFSLQAEVQDAEFEVMGGGDAVLSAVISAWLGWQRLVIALIVGFLAGTIIGALYLVHELYKRRMLKQCLAPSLSGALIGALLLEGLMYVIESLSPGWQPPWLALGTIGFLSGALLGVIMVGSRVSKPFPFGPALAIGAFVAMFCEPGGTLQSGGA